MRSADTTPEAYEVQLRIYRAMTPAQRLAIAVEMSEEASAVLASGIQRRHPEYDDDQVTWALRRMKLGDDLFHEVWPDAPLLAP